MVEEKYSLHARTRAMERYGTFLTERDLAAMVWLIETGRTEFVVLEEYPKSMWKIPYKGIYYYAIYTPDGRNILTFYPPDCEEALRHSSIKQVRGPAYRVQEFTSDQLKVIGWWRNGYGKFIPNPANVLLDKWMVEHRLGRFILSVDRRTQEPVKIEKQ